MENLIINLEEIIINLINWLKNISSGLVNNSIFQILLGVILFKLIFNLLKNLINEIRARKLGIGITGNTNELNFYRSLSKEDKEKYDQENL